MKAISILANFILDFHIFYVFCYRRTYWLANMVKEGKKITGPEQLKDAAFGCARIRGDTLGIVGLGKDKNTVFFL